MQLLSLAALERKRPLEGYTPHERPLAMAKLRSLLVP